MTYKELLISIILMAAACIALLLAVDSLLLALGVLIGYVGIGWFIVNRYPKYTRKQERKKYPCVYADKGCKMVFYTTPAWSKHIKKCYYKPDTFVTLTEPPD